MLFNSLEFALFFPCICLLYFAVPLRLRVPLLLVGSCLFYMAFIPAYILVLFLTIGIDYCAGIGIERSAGFRRRIWLVTSIVSTTAILFVFKYYNFFAETFLGIADILGWRVRDVQWNIILPIGLSFHTFQSLSYVVEVYRGQQKAEHSFVTFATYVMFFPQLVAGPIERPQNLLHQFSEVHPFEYRRVVSGLKRMAWGFFKKLVVADRLALYVNDVYGAPQAHNGLQLTIATVFFAYQIYCDFSGYSDIAIGTARVLGFRLTENFRAPYHALSVSEFWRRWHISLSTWFKDYVYVPLGGSRVSSRRWMFNVMITFGLSGLWHGAKWTYVAWGVLNGLYLIAGELTRNKRNRLFALVGVGETTTVRRFIMLATTLVLTCVAWIVFRAENLRDAHYILTHLFVGWDVGSVKTVQFQLKHFVPGLAGIIALECVQVSQRRVAISRMVGEWPGAIRWPAYAAFVFTVILFGVFRGNEFIYFQF